MLCLRISAIWRRLVFRRANISHWRMKTAASLPLSQILAVNNMIKSGHVAD